MKKSAFLLVFFIICSSSFAQKDWKELFDREYSDLCVYSTTVRENYLKKSKSPDAYDFMEMNIVIEALQCMYLSTEESFYRNDLIKMINNILSTAAVSKDIPGNLYPYKDKYLSWITSRMEAPLYEGYIFRYITQFLYNLHQSGWDKASAENQNWYNNTLQFIETNVWKKWISRSMKIHYKPYTAFLGTRTHIASHWAHVALFLKEITNNAEIKTQCIELYNMYDLLLKRNLKPNPDFPAAYTWNCSWDDVSGTQAKTSNDDVIQDVSHGNHVLGYVTIAKKMGDTNWSDGELDSLCNTVKQVVYHKEQDYFSDMVDGTPSGVFPGRGKFQAEGWIKLSWYNKEIWSLYVDFAYRREDVVKEQGELQYYANLLYAEYLLK